MPAPIADIPRSNPFCAARLRPGTIDFIFQPGENLDQLLDALAANAWQGQIIGSHGTGKSTLLAALLPALQKRGCLVQSLTLTAERTRLPPEYLAPLPPAGGHGLAAIDGFEQLSFLGRTRLKRFCRNRGVGLLVASHRSAGLPGIYQTTIDPRRAWSVVERLQSGFPARIEFGDLGQRLSRHGDNLREALFDLYDLYEARSRRRPGFSA